MEDWAPYGVGEVDENGWYEDYRVPADLKPAMPDAAPPKGSERVEIDGSLYAIAANWRLVVAELMERGVDLYDPAVRARPWPGVRTLIFSLLDGPTRLREVLIRR